MSGPVLGRGLAGYGPAGGDGPRRLIIDTMAGGLEVRREGLPLPPPSTSPRPRGPELRLGGLGLASLAPGLPRHDEVAFLLGSPTAATQDVGRSGPIRRRGRRLPRRRPPLGRRRVDGISLSEEVRAEFGDWRWQGRPDRPQPGPRRLAPPSPRWRQLRPSLRERAGPRIRVDSKKKSPSMGRVFPVSPILLYPCGR